MHGLLLLFFICLQTKTSGRCVYKLLNLKALSPYEDTDLRMLVNYTNHRGLTCYKEMITGGFYRRIYVSILITLLGQKNHGMSEASTKLEAWKKRASIFFYHFGSIK